MTTSGRPPSLGPDQHRQACERHALAAAAALDTVVQVEYVLHYSKPTVHCILDPLAPAGRPACFPAYDVPMGQHRLYVRICLAAASDALCARDSLLSSLTTRYSQYDRLHGQTETHPGGQGVLCRAW